MGTVKPRAARRGRLSRSAEFERVYRQGRSSANRYLVLYSFPNPTVECSRLGLSVSRKVAGAAQRNHIKRLLREAFARVEGDVQGGYDLVVVARPEIAGLAEREGLAGVDGALSELLQKTSLTDAKSVEVAKAARGGAKAREEVEGGRVEGEGVEGHRQTEEGRQAEGYEETEGREGAESTEVRARDGGE
jgi:ribonuclease P protein component